VHLLAQLEKAEKIAGNGDVDISKTVQELKMKIKEQRKETCLCPVCSEDDFTEKYVIKGFHIVKCNKCTMVYVNPRFPDAAIYRIYEQDYFIKSGYTFEDLGYGDYDLTANLRDMTFTRWYGVIEPHLRKKSGIALDVGCASGILLDIMKKRNWQVKGIELDRAMCEKLKTRGFDVVDNPLEQYESSEKLQLITIFDVFEHLPHPHLDFKKLHEILDDEGSIVLVTPNINSTQKKLFGKRWFQFKPREHISYFSPRTLAILAEKNGFKIVKTFSSGQYADLGFINHRLRRYQFTRLASVFEKFMRVSGLKNAAWYINTGSILVVLQKA